MVKSLETTDDIVEAVGAGLPPMHRVKEPPMLYMSTRIRWWAALGYTVKEIHHFLGVRYQQVRNVLGTSPKRAAREDLPSLEIELLEISTDLELMEQAALVENMAAQRAQDRGEKRRVNAERRALRDTGYDPEDLTGSNDDEDWVEGA